MPRKKELGRIKTSNLFKRIIKLSLQIPEKLTVSQWAEKYRVLDETSALPGRWTNDMTPYLVGIMDCFTDQYIQEINFCKSTQVGGTEALINAIGWIITQNPSPTMIVYPTDDLAKDISKDRLQPALVKTPEIKERFYKNKSKELNIKFRGMNLYLTGGGSASKLSSKSIKYLLFDEIDKLPTSTKKEASPYKLAKERTRTFTYSKKIYTCSTPTLRSNYVWNLHEEADAQFNYFVPCPHCGELITLNFKQIMFQEDEKKKMTNMERAKTAQYCCQKCGCVIENKDKPEMLRKGIWKDVKETCVGKPIRVSFWINSLYSRFLTWYDIILEFLESKDDPEKLQNFVNSWLAEPWEDTKLKTSAELVLERQTKYEAYEVPEWTKFLTAGVDVQENCLYWTIRAWGDYITSQNIAHGQVFSFSELERIMNLEYEGPTGKYIVNLALIDSGYTADDVYDFCAQNSDWSKPCKGASNSMMNHYKISKVNKSESKAYGMDLVLIDDCKYKDMIAGRMRRDNGRGSWMVYQECDLEYANQVTSEQKVTERNGNSTKQVWKVKRSHIDNHYLDCEVYALCAADILGVRTIHLKNIEEPVATPQQKNEQDTSEENWISKNESWI